jgi:hypothetical protein
LSAGVVELRKTVVTAVASLKVLVAEFAMHPSDSFCTAVALSSVVGWEDGGTQEGSHVGCVGWHTDMSESVLGGVAHSGHLRGPGWTWWGK